MANEINTSELTNHFGRQQIISYKTLRVFIGVAGITLPLLMIIGKFISSSNMQLEFSVSDYYDDGMAGDFLVGILFALGFFLFSYRGYEPIDNKIANAGAVMALGVALFPTTSKILWVHYMHFVFSILLFVVFIVFSIYLFRKTNKNETPSDEKKDRNKIYLLCGLIMIASIIGIAVGMIWFEETCAKMSLVFWGEAIALISFGISWLTKSEWLYLKDKKNT